MAGKKIHRSSPWTQSIKFICATPVGVQGLGMFTGSRTRDQLNSLTGLSRLLLFVGVEYKELIFMQLWLVDQVAGSMTPPSLSAREAFRLRLQFFNYFVIICRRDVKTVNSTGTLRGPPLPFNPQQPLLKKRNAHGMLI